MYIIHLENKCTCKNINRSKHFISINYLKKNTENDVQTNLNIITD